MWFYPEAMIAYLMAAFVFVSTTFGFAHAINREPGDRISWLEWFLSAGVGVLFGACGLALLR